MINAHIVADSIGPSKVRLTTFLLTYPRFIHSEFMTHRMISKNSASSRAIPCKKLRHQVLNSPAIPTAFSKNKAGMQASENVSAAKQKLARFIWLMSGRVACGFHWILEKLGVHKQHANRVLEPWLHMTVVATGTDWANFFALRTDKNAQPEFRELAVAMFEIYDKSMPKRLKTGEWHTPFVTDGAGDVTYRLIRSVARCARTSYLNHDGDAVSYADDKLLFDRLLGASPMHASPAEHQAMATRVRGYSGNLRGWIQHRKTLKNENITDFLSTRLAVYDSRNI